MGFKEEYRKLVQDTIIKLPEGSSYYTLGGPNFTDVIILRDIILEKKLHVYIYDNLSGIGEYQPKVSSRREYRSSCKEYLNHFQGITNVTVRTEGISNFLIPAIKSKKDCFVCLDTCDIGTLNTLIRLAKKHKFNEKFLTVLNTEDGRGNDAHRTAFRKATELYHGNEQLLAAERYTGRTTKRDTRLLTLWTLSGSEYSNSS